jgi:hypothetical protein
MKAKSKNLLLIYWPLILLIVLAMLLSPWKIIPVRADDPGPVPPVEPGLTIPTSDPLAPDANFEVRLAWFYKPPESASLSILASNYNFFILSKGDEAIRDQLIGLGARKPFLQYLRSEAIHDPGSCTAQPWRNNVAYLPGDFCMISRDHPDWFLLDRNGSRIVDSYSNQNFYLMDPMNSGWQAFFLDRVRQSLSDSNWGGVFLDNLEVTLSFREKQNEIPAKYPDDASYLNATQTLLRVLYTTYFKPNGKLLFANIVSRKDETLFPTYMTYLDGAMNEGWSIDNPNRWRPVEAWEKQMNLAEQVQAQGKYIILVGQGTQSDAELERFAFASWLLVANGRTSFRYGNSANYRQVWLYDHYRLNLGQPLGPRYQTGTTWRRNFTNGSVVVDPSTHVAQVTMTIPVAQTHPALYLPLLRK